MGFKASFLDNQKYGASHINAIVSKLTTGGIEDPLTDGHSYNTSKINDVIKAISHSGVVPEGYTACKVMGVNENTIKILKGNAFFSSGASIEIDNAGVELQFVMGKKNYVYLLSDLPNNKVTVECTLTKGDGDFVPLAEIEADGTITDKRKYAKGKLPGYQSNANGILRVKFDDLTFGSNLEVIKQVYYTPGEYSHMSFKLSVPNAVSGVPQKILSYYEIPEDNNLWLYADGGSYDGYSATKKIKLDRFSNVFCEFSENANGMQFKFTRNSVSNADRLQYVEVVLM